MGVGWRIRAHNEAEEAAEARMMQAFAGRNGS